MNDIARQRIEENKKSKDPSLNLSNLELTRIPQEIKNFAWLEQLYFDQNQINKIEELEKLAQLQVLFLDQNQINKIEGLEKLAQLQTLSLDQNQINKIEGLEKLA